MWGKVQNAQRCPIVFSQDRRTSRPCHTALALPRADLTTQTARNRRANPVEARWLYRSTRVSMQAMMQGEGLPGWTRGQRHR